MKIIFLFIILWSFDIYAESEAWNPKWDHCIQTPDCLLIKGVCGAWQPANKKFEKEVTAWIQYRNTVVDCIFKELPKPHGVECRPQKTGCANNPSESTCIENFCRPLEGNLLGTRCDKEGTRTRGKFSDTRSQPAVEKEADFVCRNGQWILPVVP